MTLHFFALYEDRAKIDAIIGKSTDDFESAHEIATQLRAQTAADFNTLDAAVKWARDAVATEKTFYGVAEVREFDRIPKTQRCRYCVCKGDRLIRHHQISESGIDETHDDDECAA